MPKMKSNRGAAKRFKRTGTGKIRRAQSHHNHILTKKDSKRKRNLRPMVAAHATDSRRVRRLLPYV